MIQIPKTTSALVKDIRTGEGIAEYALGGLVVILTALGDVTVAKGVSTGVVLVIAKGARRGLLKLIAAQKGVGIGGAIPVAGELKSSLLGGATPDQVLAEIDAAAGEVGTVLGAKPLADAPAAGPVPETPSPAKPQS